MSHRIGTHQVVSPTLMIGPDSGSPQTSPNTWALNFSPPPAPTGTLFVILHFTNASLPAGNRLEVDLGYDMDVFTAADGPDFWARPARLAAGGTVAIRYITSGGGGHVVLDQFGRGEVMESGNPTSEDFHNFTNADLFLLNSPYQEPAIEKRGICTTDAIPDPNWENIACVPAGDVRARVAPAVCILVVVEHNHDTGLMDVSSCTGTLIGPDMVLTAGHCITDASGLNEASGSVCFDFQTNCDRTRPAGYNPRFFKVNKIIRSKFLGTGSLDYALLQLKTTVSGITPVPMRADLPAANDPVFEVHHPQGMTKKVSAKHTGPQAKISRVENRFGFQYLMANTDLTGGSSGSALFDMTGNIIGIADISGHCVNGFLSVTEVMKDIAATPPLAIKRDVMMVLDRSGSMSMNAGTGRTKIEEARDATSLFVELIRAGAGDRIGLVTFSTTASSPVDFGLNLVNAGSKSTLIGPPPFSGGIVGGITPNGLTSIGDGLEKAAAQFPAPGPTVNKRTVLLMTDGLQNKPPMIAAADPLLAGSDLSVIGFGSESSLDGALLSRLAQKHGGLYTRAGGPLQLKKFFVLAFGNIFESGSLLDPEYDLPAAQNSKAFPVLVCSDDAITAVIGWDRNDTSLLVQLKTPGGNIISSGTPGVEASFGRTWMFLRVPLPIAGERDGTWEATVFRPGGGEFPPPAVDVRFFLNIVVSGGPLFRRLNPDRAYYTGDTINPLVLLRNTDGSMPHDASVKLTVTAPANGVGNVLTQAKLGPSTTLGGDVIPARQATLQGLEAQSGSPAVSYVDRTFDLFDDSMHEDGAMEPDGIFGNPLTGLLKSEGSYLFRAVATYGDQCTATREVLWSLHIDVGIDPDHTQVTTEFTGSGPGGQDAGTITITPADVYGNYLGPGRSDGITVTGVPGTTVTGPVSDNGDGSYTVPVTWDPASGQEPGVVVGQPDRPPVVVQPKPKDQCKQCGCLLGLLLAVLGFLFIRESSRRHTRNWRKHRRHH